MRPLQPSRRPPAKRKYKSADPHFGQSDDRDPLPAHCGRCGRDSLGYAGCDPSPRTDRARPLWPNRPSRPTQKLRLSGVSQSKLRPLTYRASLVRPLRSKLSSRASPPAGTRYGLAPLVHRRFTRVSIKIEPSRVALHDPLRCPGLDLVRRYILFWKALFATHAPSPRNVGRCVRAIKARGAYKAFGRPRATVLSITFQRRVAAVPQNCHREIWRHDNHRNQEGDQGRDH